MGTADQESRSQQDTHVARLYNARVPGNAMSAPALEPVLSIQEDAGFLRLAVQFKHIDRRSPRLNPEFSATIERVIPLDQVTLEVVRNTERKK